ncbi:sodium channel protein 60E-like isoform X1 [Aphis craccivora]|uniref:Sodium channel protein 60E-like isoform X1 n=1 Tax=Aphis craccivora TaxID=307492 RepID=A0A6G0ZE02_APHCR|nr:sodium channel protein 60E-like isoform X1 [Aphis craccivora]
MSKVKLIEYMSFCGYKLLRLSKINIIIKKTKLKKINDILWPLVIVAIGESSILLSRLVTMMNLIEGEIKLRSYMICARVSLAHSNRYSAHIQCIKYQLIIPVLKIFSATSTNPLLFYLFFICNAFYFNPLCFFVYHFSWFIHCPLSLNSRNLKSSLIQHSTVSLSSHRNNIDFDINNGTNSERSDEYIDFTMIITSRNNASISNFGVDTPIFEWFILVLIFASSVTLCFEDIYLDENQTLKTALYWTNFTFCVIFTIELMLKWIALGVYKYFKSFWTALDFIIAMIVKLIEINQMSIFSLLIDENENLKVLRSLRTLRALRPLRAISRWQGMRVSTSKSKNTFTLKLVFFFVFVSVYSITSRNNAPISKYGGVFRCKSEYPWCIIKFSKKSRKTKKMTEKREFLRKICFPTN